MRHLPLLPVLAVAAVCCLPAVDAPFTFDELAGIAENRRLRPGVGVAEALSYRFSPDQARPIFFGSLLLNARLSGLDPRAFRLTGLAVHLACGLLVYLLLARAWRASPDATVRSGLPLVGATLFLLHPLQSESILYVWGRSGTLATLFALASLALALAAADGGSPLRRGSLWAAALTALAIGLGAKEEAVVLPVVSYIWWTLVEGRPGRAGLRFAGLLCLPVGLFLGARWIFLGEVGRQIYARGLPDNILGQAGVTLRTVGLVLLPIRQSIDPPAEVPSPALGLLLLAACLAILCTALLLARRPGALSPRWLGSRPARRLAAGILIGAAGCLIYWLVPLPDLMSERRAYLPMFGASVALTGILGLASGRPAPPVSRRPRPVRAYLPTMVLALLLAPALYARARVWSDPRLLWEEAARAGPRRIRPWVNLGVMAAERGETDRAAALFDRAVSLDPRDPEALFNRGLLRMNAGDLEGARRDLEGAVESAPGMVKARINLGIVRIRLNDLPGAEAELRRALLVDPGDPRALTNLAEVLRATGRAPEALPLYRRALRSDPTYAHAAVRLGVALENLGDVRGALAAYRQYLDRGPRSPADRASVLDKIEALERSLRDPAAPPDPGMAGERGRP